MIMIKQPKTIAFQGEPGAFSELAARKLLGESVKTVAFSWFDKVFQAVMSGKVDAAMVPIENTLHGSVHENYDHLLKNELEIVAETQIRIVHNLMAPPGVSFKQIKRVYSHPVALSQCLDFFAANPQFQRETFYDTAGSAKKVMQDNATDAAAIASEYAAQLYGAKILKRAIEDDKANFTRFFLLYRPKAKFHHPEGDQWKTSVVFAAKNQPGALYRAMSAFSLRDLNLTKIESRPLRGKPFEYMFYLDFLGKASDPVSQRALAHLAEFADFSRVLGTYPRGR
jgi:prephenate dehydratase